MNRNKNSSLPADVREIARLKSRLSEAEATLQAIGTGDVDTVVVPGKRGTRVFTLQGADHPYRVLIESMKGGALTLSAEALILYANPCFAGMVKRPLEQILGSSFLDLVSNPDQVILQPLLKRKAKSGSNILAFLQAEDGAQIPVQISLRPLQKGTFDHAVIGVVVTDMTEARRMEEMLRAFSHRMVQVQEAERARVASELHDGITQYLCAILFHSEAVVAGIAADNPSAKATARKLNDLASKTADAVERISKNLRPSILENLGLTAAIRAASDEFMGRTGIAVKLQCVEFADRLPQDSELAFFRILQEALRNIEKHAKAHSVKVRLLKSTGFAELEIQDDGIGFIPELIPTKRKGRYGLGLLSMRERATQLGGLLTLVSNRGEGTRLLVKLPLSAKIKSSKTKAAKAKPVP